LTSALQAWLQQKLDNSNFNKTDFQKDWVRVEVAGGMAAVRGPDLRAAAEARTASIAVRTMSLCLWRVLVAHMGATAEKDGLASERQSVSRN
jgi:hypothetical protein